MGHKSPYIQNVPGRARVLKETFEYIQENLRNGLKFTIPRSPTFVSPIPMAEKPDHSDELFFCFDYCQLNVVTE